MLKRRKEMSIKRIIAMVLIYGLTCCGWLILGLVTSVRSFDFSDRLRSEVNVLWGAPLVQKEPLLTVKIPGSEQVRRIMPVSNDIKVGMELDYRKKGLIWYPTYIAGFDGSYTITNTEDVKQKIILHFEFPLKGGTYDQLGIFLDGKRLDTPVSSKEGISEIIELPPEKSSIFRVTYKTRGFSEWKYRVNRNTGRIRNLTMVVKTDFKDIDYTPGSLSAMESREIENGMELTWKAADLITDQDFGIIVPEKLNPGPLASRITFFAPVCLIFYFFMIVTISIVRKIKIHPVHFLFVSASFFAFHLLLVYFIDHINIHVALAVSALTSILLVNLYLRAAVGKAFPWLISTAAQIFFLVLFSYSFFLKGMSGLTGAVGSVVTLAVIMKVTTHVDWEKVFEKREDKEIRDIA